MCMHIILVSMCIHACLHVLHVRVFLCVFLCFFLCVCAVVKELILYLQSSCSIMANQTNQRRTRPFTLETTSTKSCTPKIGTCQGMWNVNYFHCC